MDYHKYRKKLLEYCQKKKYPDPVYKTTKTEDDTYGYLYDSTVTVNNRVVNSAGWIPSYDDAEEDAAKRMLNKISVVRDPYA